MRIIFAGTPHFADTALAALLAAQHSVIAVFTQPDRPAGRGMKLTPSPVKQTALNHQIPVYQPRSLRLDGKFAEDAQEAFQTIHALSADIMVVAAYGLILPQWVLDAPKTGCVNIHASLLPRWRGAAPIQRAIEAGDTESGVCLMHMDIGLDTGAVYARQNCPISAQTTAGELHDQLAQIGASLLIHHLPNIVNQSLSAVPQPTSGINYAHKLQRSDGVLDFSNSAEVLARRIRAFDPTPGCSFEQDGQMYKVWAAHTLPNTANMSIGRVLSVTAQGIQVSCSTGILNITQIQKPGGKRLAVKECWQTLQHLVSPV